MNIPERHVEVLRMLTARLPVSEINWALTGSTSFALQGIPLQVNDIDVQTDKGGAYEIESRFSEYSHRKVTFSTADIIKSHFGALLIKDLEVEIMGAVQKRTEDGSWEEPVKVEQYRKYVTLRDFSVPVLDLHYEQQAAKRLGRLRKADVIKHYIDEEQESTGEN